MSPAWPLSIFILSGVLILVLVEDGLGATWLGAGFVGEDGVLILVLVEDGLGESRDGSL